jgi:hypothetical protein
MLEQVSSGEVILAAKVRPSEDLIVEQRAREMDEIDTRLRAELHEAGRCSST